MASIEISSICNLKCRMCPYQHKDIKRGLMTWKTFTKLADELYQSNEIHLFNRGEPFTHPRIYDMIDYLQEKGTKVIISTNALLMDEKRIYNHLKNGALVVSCHAGNRETYKEITGTDGYDEVIRKAKYLEKNKPGGVEFYVKMVDLPENKGQVETLKGLFQMVHIVEDSNQENPHGYETCSQPDVCPTWEFDGTKKVCCRDLGGEWTEERYELGKKRLLEDCKICNIR